jgi:formylglycine-generating enzyme required for sulfatase activity
MGTNPSKFKGAKNPMEMVSWNDAQEFCKRLSKKTDYAVSLPTEVQWEYACRAGTTTDRYFGDDESRLGEYAWYSSNSGTKTQPVGTKKPNVWDLYDMHGNVWEWCLDWYESGYCAKYPALDPKGPNTGLFRMARGGSWDTDADDCRVSYRFSYEPENQIELLGFRIVAVRRD